MDEYLCGFRERQIIQELEDIDEKSLEYKELEKEMYEIDISSSALKHMDSYCEALETTSNYTREYMEHQSHPDREERIRIDMTREMWEFLCYRLGKKETYALEINNIEDLYKKIREEDITLIMNRAIYKEKHDGEKTEKEKLYDNSIVLMQLGMMEKKFLQYLLTKEKFDEEGIAELFGEKSIEEIKDYIQLKEMAIKKFELEFFGYKDYYDNEDSMIDIKKAIDVLESWINEETVFNDEKEYNEFYKKRNEILRYAVEKLEKLNK